jgi:4-hydroxy-2-oxoheptanedioate aldolase
MKRNPVKAALKAGKPQVGTWLSFGNVLATRLMARVGFPWLTVDLEHSPIDWSDAAILFGAIADAGCVPLVRVPRGDHDHIKRVLDAGAWGIVVPMVDTVEEAKLAIAAAKYPPVGNRSIGGSLHAINFGAASGDYYKHANDEILVVLQTESPRGVHNAEAISRPKCGTKTAKTPPTKNSKPCCNACWPSERKSARRWACTFNLSRPSKNGSWRAGSSSPWGASCE